MIDGFPDIPEDVDLASEAPVIKAVVAKAYGEPVGVAYIHDDGLVTVVFTDERNEDGSPRQDLDFKASSGSGYSEGVGADGSTPRES